MPIVITLLLRQYVLAWLHAYISCCLRVLGDDMYDIAQNRLVEYKRLVQNGIIRYYY